MNDLENLKSAEELAKRHLERLVKHFKGGGRCQSFEGLSTGCAKLDELIQGLQAGELVGVTGCKYSGYDKLVMAIARHAALKSSVPVLYFSAAEESDLVFRRMLCSEAGIEYSKLLAGMGFTWRMKKLEAAMGLLSNSRLYMDDTPLASVEQMMNTSRRLDARLKNEGRCLGLIVVDQLQALDFGCPGENREKILFEVVTGLKRLAVKLHVPVLLLSELKMEDDVNIEKIDWQEMLDFSGYGDIQRVVDMFVYVRRPSFYDPKPGFSGSTKIHVFKERSSRGGMTTLTYNSIFGAFQEYKGRGCSVLRHGLLNPDSIPLCRKLREIVLRDFPDGFSAKALLFHPELEQEERDCVQWHLFFGTWVYSLGADIYCRRANPVNTPATRWEEEWLVIDYSSKKEAWAAEVIETLKLSAGDMLRAGDLDFVRNLTSAINKAADKSLLPAYPPEYHHLDFADELSVYKETAERLEKRFGKEFVLDTSFLLAVCDEIGAAGSTHWCRIWKDDIFSGTPPFDDNYLPQNKLCLAAFRGDLDIVSKELARGADLNQQDYTLTPLDYAVREEHLEIVRLLLEARPPTLKADEGINSALRYAIKTDNMAVVKLLVDKGADVNDGGENTSRPIHLAAGRGSIEMTEYLIAKGVEVNAFWDGFTPLDSAMAGCRLEIVRVLKTHGGLFGVNQNIL